MARIEAWGTGLRRYVIDVVNDGDASILVIYRKNSKKAIVQLLLRGEERTRLIEALSRRGG